MIAPPDLTTKAAEIRAGLGDRILLIAETSFLDQAATDDLREAAALIERQAAELAEAHEATAFADENRTFQIERAEKAEAAAKDLRRLLKVNDDPPKPGFHCACAYHQQTAAQVEECGAHADLRARAEKAEREWDAALKNARFWEEKHYAQMDAVSAAIGPVRFMDPPDGGDVSLAEQVKRMREALAVAESERDELLREKERLGAGWRPIETAPKDGTTFLAYQAEEGVDFFHWQDFGADSTAPKGWRDSFIHVYPEGSENGPKHWMPLPVPPAAEQEAV